jgi:hypothetical protein
VLIILQLLHSSQSNQAASNNSMVSFNIIKIACLICAVNCNAASLRGRQLQQDIVNDGAMNIGPDDSCASPPCISRQLVKEYIRRGGSNVQSAERKLTTFGTITNSGGGTVTGLEGGDMAGDETRTNVQSAERKLTTFGTITNSGGGTVTGLEGGDICSFSICQSDDA